MNKQIPFKSGDRVRLYSDQDKIGTVVYVYSDGLCYVQWETGRGSLSGQYTPDLLIHANNVTVYNPQDQGAAISMLVSSPSKSATITSIGCNHEYKHYIGLSESFKYCIHCDKKEPENSKDTIDEEFVKLCRYKHF